MHKNKISDTAVISKKAVIGKKVTICDNAFIADNAVIGDGTFVGRGVIIGEFLKDYYRPGRYVNPSTKIGKKSILRSGTVVYAGSLLGEGFQSGHNAVIREYSIFGKNCSFGTFSQTDGYVKIGNGCRFHNNVFIASYTVIKDRAHFYPYSLTLDSIHPPCKKCRKGPVIGEGAIIGAGVIILPHINIGKYAVLGSGSIVATDIPPHKLAYGSPAVVKKDVKKVVCRKNKNYFPYPMI